MEREILYIYVAFGLAFAFVGFVFSPKKIPQISRFFKKNGNEKGGFLGFFSSFVKESALFFKENDSPLLKKYYHFINKQLIASELDEYFESEGILFLQLLMPLMLLPFYFLAVFRIDQFEMFRAFSMSTLAVSFIFLIGFLLPLVILKDKVLKRQKAISRELPFALDMITSAVSAGLDFSGAIRRFMEKSRKLTPLKKEFKFMLKEISIGKTRSQALLSMSERVNLNELTSVVNALIQADQLGTSVGTVLTNLSDDLRIRRFQKAEKMALEAPVKMLFPLIAFIFPAVFIILIGPMIIQIISQIGSN